MKIILATAGIILTTLVGSKLSGPKKVYRIETADVDHFWQAYDSLRNTHSYADSLRVITKVYLGRMTPDGKKYIAARRYTDTEFIKTIRKYPIFLKELRTKTDQLRLHYAEIASAFSKLDVAIPGYKIPDVCFAIGCFRGGGTISKSKDAVLIGCEIALADSAMDIHEFSGTLRRMFSHATGNISQLVAHESVHCQQWNGQNNTLLSLALSEGTADMLANKLLDIPISNEYGLKHECELWQEFKPGIDRDEVSAWMYNTSLKETRPADLGYFIGMRISEAYYDKQDDKRKAITFMLNRANYREVLTGSGYNGHCEH